MVLIRQHTPRFASTVSAFSMIPSDSAIDAALNARPGQRREISTFSGVSSARNSRYPSSLSSIVWSPRSSMETCVGEGTTADEPMQPTADALPTIEIAVQEDIVQTADKGKTKKKKRLLIRVVRKAGSLASKKLGIKKSGPKVRELPDLELEIDQQMEAIVKAWEKAAAPSVSRTSTNTLRDSPPASGAALPKEHRTECPEYSTYSVDDISDTFRSDEELPPPINIDYVKLLKRIALFLPHTVLIGFAPFFFPTKLTDIAFSRAAGYGKRPSSAAALFIHHASLLPCQSCLAIGLFGLTLWLLFRLHPGFAVVVAALAFGRAKIAWSDYDTSVGIEHACLGTDDRDTIYWILRGYALGDLWTSYDDFKRWLNVKLEGNAEGMEDEELESFEWNWGDPSKNGPVNFLIRLKDRPQETMRIVIDGPESI